MKRTNKSLIYTIELIFIIGLVILVFLSDGSDTDIIDQSVREQIKMERLIN